VRSDGAFRTIAAAFWGGFWFGLGVGALIAATTIAANLSAFPPASLWRILAAAVQCTILHGFLISTALAVLAATAVAGGALVGRTPSPRSGGLRERVPGAGRILSGRPVHLVVAAAVFASLWLTDRAALRQAAAPPAGARKNLVLVVVDALRADHLGCYGYTRPTSPNLDALAMRATLFERAFTQYPATGPSFGSLFTGKYPRKHGLSAMDPRSWLGGSFNRTLAEVLSEQGYRTGAIITGSLTRSSGLARGFDTVFEEFPHYGTYDVRSPWQVLRSRLPISRAYVHLRMILDPKIVVSEAERWIAKRGREPFFLFVHLYDTHSPYDPPRRWADLFDPAYGGRYPVFRERDLRAIAQHRAPLAPRDLEHLKALYDAEVRSADESIGRLLRMLGDLGLLEDTIVVVTADHGEELYEHGTLEHGHIFNTNLRVPLLIFAPGVGGMRRIGQPVELIDILPTVLHLLGVPPPPHIDGRPLSLDGDRAFPGHVDSYAFSEAACGPVSREQAHCLVAVQDERWKLVMDKSAERMDLFDLANDPLEHRNVAVQHPEVASRLEARLRDWDAAQPNLEALRGDVKGERREIRDRLRALGYIQ
jgi:arylsulfatase A-like enzyme